MPMSNSDITDGNGKGEVGEIVDDKIYDYIVTVYDETGLIKDALITLISDDNSVLVCLPNGKVIDYFNRMTVKVVRADGTPVEDWKVSVYNKDGSGLRTEITDDNGIVIVPPLSEAPISKPTPTPNPDDEEKPLPGVEPTPTPSEPTDNPNEPTPTPGETDKPSEPTPIPGETEKPSEPTPTPDLGDGSVVQNKNYKYRVYVWDNGGIITEFGLIKLQDNGDLIIELPENKLLDENNKTYIKVINENDETPVKTITVNVTDVSGANASDITNSYGIAVVPVSDTDITDIKGNAQVKDSEGNAKADIEVTLKDKKDNSAVGTTDSDGTLILPATEHKAYVVGYEDGEFKPENNMTRAEAAAIFARNIAERKGENITSKKPSFTTFNFLIAMIYSQLFNLLCEKADDVYGGRLPVHVRCLIDECANIGQIPNLEKLMATIRSREVSACLVLQAQSQLKALYKESADTIIGNCDTSIFLGGKEPTTLKELNQALGKETIDTYNTGESRGREVSHSLNYQKLGKDLASVDELSVLDGGKCILQLRGVRPFKSDKYDITAHPKYKYLSDANPKNAFDIEKYLKCRLKIKKDEVYEVFEVNVSH